ncbi:MFS transporter [Nocardioides panacis]|uniref:MFS transporter n=1 Tax=Nocardioides panacis TaxID=2849501 RepID=A0A975SYC8_9ACTN|nr:MFS transporter [Nocardioides panacis]QWZ07680.1 MFS transporter [Nocardioides panacis]
MRAAFRTPGFGRLYAGLGASMFGDSLMLIVLSMWVKTLTGSNGAAGATFLAMTAPALLAPVLGYVVDRVPRRTFLVVANVLSALVMAPLLLVHDAGDVWIVYAVAFCYGISFVVVPAALNGLLKDLLPEDVLVEANASLSVTREALRLVGPLLGAATFSVAGGGVVAMADAVSFLLAALAVAGLRVEERRDDSRAPQHWRVEVLEGASFIRRTPLLLHTTTALALALLVIGFAESAVYAVVEAFGHPVSFVGPLLTVQGVGAVSVGLVASRVVRRFGEPAAVVVGLLVTALGLLGVVVADRTWQLLVTVAVLGGGIPLIFVAFNTLLQKQTPGRLMGRVSASVEVLVTTPQALSIGVGAVLVGLLDYRLIFAIMAAGTTLAAGYLALTLRSVRGAPVPGEASLLPAHPDSP